jgi:2,4-dienoyl-CoA reductase-like NADH-dependent reductase (Old Yellow Enzyme family)
VSKEGITAINFPGTFCDKDIPSIKERADIVKAQGALAINQIHHGGALALKQYSGMVPVVPSKDIAVEDAKKEELILICMN